MKKRILSAVALLCMVVCLSGCSNIEWVTQTYEDITFQVPAEWEASDNSSLFISSEDSAVPGSVLISSSSSGMYSSPAEYMESYMEEPLNGTLIQQNEIDISGVPGSHYELSFTQEGETFSLNYYLFTFNDTLYIFNFDGCEENVREHVVNSIQINE